MKIVAGGCVFKSEKSAGRQSCAFPGLCVLPSGRWLAGCRAAPAKLAVPGQHVLISWSDDQGKSWRVPFSPFPLQKIDGQPGLFRTVQFTALGSRQVLAVLYWVDASDLTRPFFNEETEGLLDSRIFLSRSGDDGETWSEPELISTPPFDIPTPITGPVLLLPDGSWACQYELNKRYYDTAVWRHSSVLSFSRDEGKTWPEHKLVSNDPDNRIFYWDQRVNVLPDGTIFDVFWTYDRQAAVYRNIHAAESRDSGRTWSESWDTGVPGQPANVQPAGAGRLLMVYVDRTGPSEIKARLSSDQGRTWPKETELVVYRNQAATQTRRKKTMQDAWAEMGDFSVGLPITGLLPDGDVLVFYYAGPETDSTDIRWCRIRID